MVVNNIHFKQPDGTGCCARNGKNISQGNNYNIFRTVSGEILILILSADNNLYFSKIIFLTWKSYSVTANELGLFCVR